MIGLNPLTFEAGIDARVLAALNDDPEQAVPWQDFCDRLGLSSDDLRASLRRLCLRTTEGPAGAAES